MAKLSAKALAKYEASRNLGEELLAAAREIKAGKAAREHHIKVPEILEARVRTGLSQQKSSSSQPTAPAPILTLWGKRSSARSCAGMGVAAAIAVDRSGFSWSTPFRLHRDRNAGIMHA